VPDRNWQAETALLQERDRKSRAVLGVSETADTAEIRRAFRRASLAHHPDVNGGDGDASTRFHLACCAYRFLAEGEACAALDKLEIPPPPRMSGTYRLDNPWGYWCWWRENYFGELIEDASNASL